MSSSGCQTIETVQSVVPDHSKTVESVEAVDEVIIDPEDKAEHGDKTKVTDAVVDTNLVRDLAWIVNEEYYLQIM